MKSLVWVLFILFLLAFQGSVLNPLVIHGIRPDLILITVYLLGILKGDIKGGLIGASLGFIMDILSAGPVYYNVFSKCFIGSLAGVIGRWIQNPGPVLHAGMIFAASLLQGIGALLILAFLGMARLPQDLFYITIPQAIFDGALGGIVYLFLTTRRKRTISRWAV